MDEAKRETNPEAIFFDLGGVLIDISFDNFLPFCSPLHLLAPMTDGRHDCGNMEEFSEILGEIRVF